MNKIEQVNNIHKVIDTLLMAMSFNSYDYVFTSITDLA